MNWAYWKLRTSCNRVDHSALTPEELRQGIEALDLILQGGGRGELDDELERLPKYRYPHQCDLPDHGNELADHLHRLLGVSEEDAALLTYEYLSGEHFERARLAAILRAAERVAKRVTSKQPSRRKAS